MTASSTTVANGVVLAPGIHSARPAIPIGGAVYPCTTHNTIDRYDPTTGWGTWATLGAVAAADVLFTAEGTPSAPAAGKFLMYVDSADNVLKIMNSAGVSTVVGSGGGGSVGASAVRKYATLGSNFTSSTSGSYTTITGLSFTITPDVAGVLMLNSAIRVSHSATGAIYLKVVVSPAPVTGTAFAGGTREDMPSGTLMTVPMLENFDLAAGVAYTVTVQFYQTGGGTFTCDSSETWLTGVFLPYQPVGTVGGGFVGGQTEPNSGADLLTTSTSLADMTGYSKSVPAQVGDILEVTLVGTTYPQGSATLPLYVEFGISANGTDVGPRQRHYHDTNTTKAMSLKWRRVVTSGDLSGGVVPIKTRWKVGSGGAQWCDGGTAPLYGSLQVVNLSLSGVGPFSEANVVPVAPNDQTGTTYTFVYNDGHRIVTLSNASAITATIPTSASSGLPVGSMLQWVQKGAGQVTVAGASGVTLQQAHGLKTLSQWSVVTAVMISTDVWVVTGDTTT